MTQEFRYLCDRAALNEIIAKPKDIIVRKVELVEVPDECLLRITFREFADERRGRRQTLVEDFSFPDVDTARTGMRDLRHRGGYRHKECLNLLPR